MSNMQDVIKAELLGQIDYDDGVVDAARVSMAKRASNFTPEENAKLMRYLASLRHWSPYGHQRDTFRLQISDKDWIKFLENATLAGFSFYRELDEATVLLNGSLWAWHEGLGWLPEDIRDDVIHQMQGKYPVASAIFWPNVPDTFHGKATLEENIEVNIHTSRIHYLTFRLKSPISLARQLVKHQVHLCWNEESRRYITDEVEFYVPELRAKAEKIKQGSKDEVIPYSDEWEDRIKNLYGECDHLYEHLLRAGCAPEQARNVLPIGSVTNWVWTGSLDAWHRVCRQRMDSHAQKEAQVIAQQISNAIWKRYPDMWEEMWRACAI